VEKTFMRYPNIFARKGTVMKKIWNKPTVTEQEVGLEVTSYSPAEIGVS
jgi:coenzyme PQQ precursor peptide PqqA